MVQPLSAHPSAKGTSGGEHERGSTPSSKGGLGVSHEKIFKFKMSVAGILVHFEAIFACETRLIMQTFHEAVFKSVSNTPPPKYEQLWRPLDKYYQAVASKFPVTKSNDSYLQHVLYVDKV